MTEELVIDGQLVVLHDLDDRLLVAVGRDDLAHHVLGGVRAGRLDRVDDFLRNLRRRDLGEVGLLVLVVPHGGARDVLEDVLELVLFPRIDQYNR